MDTYTKIAIAAALQMGLSFHAYGQQQIDLTKQVKGTLPQANGGTGQTITGVYLVGGTLNGGQICTLDSTTATINCTITFAVAPLAGKVASGTVALGTAAIAGSACGTPITVTGTGIATTDVVLAGFNADPSGTTGFVPGAMLAAFGYPIANNAVFKVCNNTTATITLGSEVLNWKVFR